MPIVMNPGRIASSDWKSVEMLWFVFVFASSARAHERARIQNIRDFRQTNLDSEIKAAFLLNEHGDPHFLFYKFNENNICNN